MRYNDWESYSSSGSSTSRSPSSAVRTPIRISPTRSTRSIAFFHQPFVVVRLMHNDQPAFHELLAAQRALDEALLDQIWRQWRLIGASATARGNHASVSTVVDPEALILVSLLYSTK